jgi:hypothetical protein
VSERITWESCPNCGGMAAVGWTDEEPIEFDCVLECRLTEQQQAAWRRELATRR